MKKTAKIVTLILLVISVMLFSSTIVNATGATGAVSNAGSTVDGLFNNGNADTGNLETVGANIVSIITTVGIIVAVIVLLILGIKYMMGSAAEKAEYKKTMIPYLIGAVLIFGASAIAKAVIAASQMVTGS